MKDVSESAIGKVHRRGLITGGGSCLLRLSWKLFILPITIIGSVSGLITGSIRLGFWITGSVLSYSLTMIGLTSSRRHRPSPPEPITLSSESEIQSNPESPPSPPVSISESATASKALNFLMKFENLSIPESPPFPPVSITDSTTASEVKHFLSEFEAQYRTMHPDFIPESFTDAVRRSRREFKLLLVYLHAPDHPDTPSFCKETLCSDVVSSFVNENFVAWSDSITSNGGLKISRSLKASRFPFLAVIMVATGQKISLLRQFEGPASPKEMLTQLQSVLEEHTSSLIAARLNSNEHTKNSESKEQDVACHGAPQADQANEDQTQVDGEVESTRLFEEKALSLGPEPEKGPGVTQVLVRLPNGERKGRRFHCSATLQSVYDFVDSSGCLEVGSYTLVTFFPRVLYGEDELSSTIEELGLYTQASLFVELKT